MRAVASKRGRARVVAADVDHDAPAAVKLRVEPSVERRDIKIGTRIYRRDQADTVFLRQRLEVGAAEIWVYNIKIDKRDFLAGGAQAHRQIHRQIRFSAAVMTCYNHNPV